MKTEFRFLGELSLLSAENIDSLLSYIKVVCAFAVHYLRLNQAKFYLC